MRTFKIVGNCEVAGKILGESLTEIELGSANVDALIAGGHIIETHTKAAQADNSEE